MIIKNIIFDFGGVLMNWNPEYVYREVFKTEAEMKYFLSEICNDDWNSRQDSGRSFAEATEVLVKKHPKFEKEIRLYFPRWIDMIKGDIPENVSLLKPLKNSFRLFGLTNWSAETFPIVYNDSKYSFFKLFEGVVVSGEEGVIKPDNHIFETLLERYVLKANESLFIDDNKNNIIAANTLRFRTIHLDTDIVLSEELKKHNINIE